MSQVPIASPDTERHPAWRYHLVAAAIIFVIGVVMTITIALAPIGLVVGVIGFVYLLVVWVVSYLQRRYEATHPR